MPQLFHIHLKADSKLEKKYFVVYELEMFLLLLLLERLPALSFLFSFSNAPGHRIPAFHTGGLPARPAQVITAPQ